MMYIVLSKMGAVTSFKTMSHVANCKLNITPSLFASSGELFESDTNDIEETQWRSFVCEAVYSLAYYDTN